MIPSPHVVLEARGVHVRAGGKELLSGVDIAVRAGAVTALLGPNGAGKSTLLKVLSGTLSPAAGRVTLCGRPLPAWDPGDTARRRAVLLQEFHVPFAFTVEEVAAMGRHPHAGAGHGRAHEHAVVERCLDDAGVLHLRGRELPTLSGGERQRAHWARVLAQLDAGSDLAGKCLLLDEPTASLDPAHQHALLHHARRLARAGCAVLVILHDLNLAAAYADHLVLLRAGRVFAAGAPDEVMTAEILSNAYDIRAGVMRHPGHGRPWMYVHDEDARVPAPYAERDLAAHPGTHARPALARTET